ncbi:hypothetical protein AK972_1229 [Pseudomonas yamanorum]|nr:hypothetical protein AK972_1229 [Pseudomonas yamanorum]
MTHETPQDADSATFARCKASAKTGFSRAVLSFLWSDACICSKGLNGNRHPDVQEFAGSWRQRYLSASIFVWQAA